MDHADYRGEKREWRLDVEQRVEQCQDIDSVLLIVTVTGMVAYRSIFNIPKILHTKEKQPLAK